MIKAAYVGRHVLLPSQAQAIKVLGLELVEKIENLPTEQPALNALIARLKSQGITAILTVALPPHFLATLSSAFDVFVFEMKSTTMQNITEAEKWVAENPSRRTYLPGRPGEPVRCLEFTGVNKVKVIVQSERVYTVP